MKLAERPHPGTPTLTIQTVAAIFGVCPKTLYNALSEYRQDLAPPMYRVGSDGRPRRMISQADVKVLRTIFTVRVKLKRTTPETSPQTSPVNGHTQNGGYAASR